MSAPEQLTIDGGAVPYPPPRPRHLTERQRYLLAFMRSRADNHGLPLATRQAKPFFVDASGALRRLEGMGLVRHTARGFWKPT